LVIELICRKYLEDQFAIDPTFTFVPVNLTDKDSQCHSAQVQELTTAFILYTGLVGGIPAAMTSPILGELSDRFGRRPLMIVITFGGLIGEVIIVLAVRYPDTVHYSWLLAASFIDGLCGSFITGWAMTHSYTADCVHPSKRAVAFGYFHACFFTGIALGPIVAAYMFKLTGSRISIFYLALACHSLFFLAVTFIIPESLSKRRQLIAREKYALEKRARRGSSSILLAIKSNNIFAPLKILYPTGEGSSPQLRMNLLLLSTINSIMFGIAISSTSVIILYSGYQFKWTDYETNLFQSVANSCRVTSLVILLPALTYIFRTRYKNKVESGTEMVKRNSGSDNFDSWTIRISLLVDIAGFSGYAFFRRGDLFFMSGALASLGGIGSPTLQSVLVKHVPHDRTGQLLGATGLLHALVRVVCPPIFSSIYIATVKSFPQMVFIVLAGCFALALVLSCFVKPHGKRLILPPNHFVQVPAVTLTRLCSMS
jgi:MFS family permease